MRFRSTRTAHGEMATAAFCRVLVAQSTSPMMRTIWPRSWRTKFSTATSSYLTPAGMRRNSGSVDGTAEWAAELVTGFESGWLDSYVRTVNSPLFARTYDAMGFFGHADEVGGREVCSPRCAPSSGRMTMRPRLKQPAAGPPASSIPGPRRHFVFQRRGRAVEPDRPAPALAPITLWFRSTRIKQRICSLPAVRVH